MTVHLSEKTGKYLIVLILFIATLAVYGQVKDYGFVNLDDKQYILDNPHVLSGLTADGIKWAFTSVYASNWHPLTWMSHMLDVSLFGKDAGRFHIVNVLLHLASTLLLFVILNRMTHALFRSAFVAAVFALHPLHVESVAWIAERKDVLSTLFWMLTLGAYVLYAEKKGLGRYLCVLGCLSLGLLSKPMLVTLPFVLLLLDFWPLNRLQAAMRVPQPVHAVVPGAGGAGKDKRGKKKKAQSQGTEIKKATPAPPHAQTSVEWSRLWPLILEKSPLFVLSAISSIATIYAQNQGGALASMDAVPLSARLSNALISYVFYIAKTVWPWNLAVFYPYPGEWPLWQAGAAFLLLAAVTALAIYFLRRYPYLAVGWLWYLGTLVPVIGVLQVGMQSMADRYTYVPMIGLLVAVTWGLSDLAAQGGKQRQALVFTAVAALALLSISGWMQVQYWRDSISLFRRAVSVTQNNYLAHNNLAVALNAAGDSAGAVFHYNEALRIRPRYAGAHYNYANYLSSHGGVDEAIAHYREAVRINPNYFNAHNNLGLAYAARKDFKTAVAHFQEALRIQPDSAGAHHNMAVALASQNNVADAERHLREAVRIQPDFAEAHNDLGMILAMQGRLEEGARHFREALLIKPNYASASHNLKLALENMNRSR